MINDERIVSLLSIVGRGKGAQYIRMVKEKGRIKVVAIGPEATPPESKAIPV